MIDIVKSPDFLVAIKLSGDITAGDIDSAAKALDGALAKNERVSIFAELDKTASYTIEGFFKDLVEGINRINKLGRIYRAAVVTDKGWVAAMSRVEGLLFSSIDVRVFSPEQSEEGMRWASEKPEPLPEPKPPEPGIRMIQTTAENVFAYEIDGRMTEMDVKSVVSAVNDKFERNKQVNVIALVKNYDGFDLGTLFSDGLWSVKLRSFSKVEKYAVVAPPAWMRNLLELIRGVLPMQVKLFDAGDEAAAWEWVGATQALLPESSVGA